MKNDRVACEDLASINSRLASVSFLASPRLLLEAIFSSFDKYRTSDSNLVPLCLATTPSRVFCE